MVAQNFKQMMLETEIVKTENPMGIFLVYIRHQREFSVTNFILK